MKKRPYLIIVAVLIFGVTLAGWYLWRQVQQEEDGSSGNSIVKVESDGENDNSTNSSLMFAGYVKLLSDEKVITLNFTNPSKSKKSLDLEVVANIDGEDVVLAKSDIIRPGYRIEKLVYSSDRDIPKGDYKGKYIVHFFNERGEEEIVNSEIAIDVYVK